MAYKKKEVDLRRKYSDNEKREVALQYIMCGTQKGSVERVKKLNPRFNKLAYATVGDWLKTESFQEMISEVADAHEFRIRAKFNQIIDQAQDNTLERLREGNAVLDKDGTLKYVPVNAKDSMIIGAVGYDKKRISENKPTSISGNVGNKALENLAKQFEKIADESKMRQIRRNESIKGEYKEITPPESA